MQPIAIIGVGCLFPGAKCPDEFWQNLAEGRDSRTVLTRQMLGVEPDALYAAEKGATDRFYSTRGGYITDFEFDPNGYALPAEAFVELDAQYQWSLYVAQQALADSGYLNTSGLAKTGIILGNLS